MTAEVLAATTFLHSTMFWAVFWVIGAALITVAILGSTLTIAGKIIRAIAGLISWTVLWLLIMIFGILLGAAAVAFDADHSSSTNGTAVHTPS